MLPNTALAIIGATASGKTDLSIACAQKLGVNAEIVCADSRQIYKHLDIGTTKPTPEEQSLVPHHCIDIVEIDQDCSAGAYASIARPIIGGLISNNALPIMVGGSGLYIKALCEGFFSMPGIDSTLQAGIRTELNQQLEEHGKDWLFDQLFKVDPESCALYSDKNPRRILRALEFYRITGWRFSEKKSEMEDESTFVTKYVGIEMPREELYDRINKRTEQMWEALVEETKKVLAMGYSPTLNALNTVGYKEAIAFIYGNISEKEAIEKMKQSTRNYAKRQLTWFRRNPAIHWISGEREEMVDKVASLLQVT